MKTLNDLELTEMYINGSMQAGNEIVSRYYNMIRRYIGSKLKYSMMVDDVVQETFIKLLKKLKAGKFDSKKSTNLKQFCYVISYSTMIDMIRSNKSGVQLVSNYPTEDFDIYTVTKYDSKTIELEMIEEQRTEIVHKLMSTLEEKYMNVILLTFFEEKTQMEIASILDIPLGTVKSRVAIGLRELRKSKYFKEFIYELS